MPGYTDAEKRTALDLVARVGITEASRQLRVPRATLNRFRTALPEYWSDLMKGPDVHQVRRSRTAESLEDLAEAYTEREFEALERAASLIKTADPKELAALMRAMGGSRAHAATSSRAYRGEDVQQVQHNINFEALEQAAAAILNRAPAPQLPVHVINEAEVVDAD